MTITILTLFPDMFSGPFSYSIVKRAVEQSMVTINTVNIRDYATDAYRTVDDHPYGGGPGMILKVDVVDRCLTDTVDRSGIARDRTQVVLMDAAGSPFTHAMAASYARLEHLILVCGHYEGVDARIFDLVDATVSIGDFVVTGGELPAMLVTDAVVRLIPGVLKKAEAVTTESFAAGLLEYPQYTRPDVYKDRRVPDVLLSGNHRQIEAWKEEQSVRRTRANRPDLPVSGDGTKTGRRR